MPMLLLPARLTRCSAEITMCPLQIVMLCASGVRRWPRKKSGCLAVFADSKWPGPIACIPMPIAHWSRITAPTVVSSYAPSVDLVARSCLAMALARPFTCQIFAFLCLIEDCWACSVCVCNAISIPTILAWNSALVYCYYELSILLILIYIHIHAHLFSLVWNSFVAHCICLNDWI